MPRGTLHSAFPPSRPPSLSLSLSLSLSSLSLSLSVLSCPVLCARLYFVVPPSLLLRSLLSPSSLSLPPSLSSRGRTIPERSRTRTHNKESYDFMVGRRQRRAFIGPRFGRTNGPADPDPPSVRAGHGSQLLHFTTSLLSARARV